MAQVYHIRTIDSETAPIPQKLIATRYDLDKDSYRSASGLLIRNKVAEKMKFELTFPPMHKDELQDILDLLDKDVLAVQYEDIISGTLVTGNFYRGDMSVEPIWIKSEDNTDVLYAQFKISLIEY